jgi:HEAT repeats
MATSSADRPITPLPSPIGARLPIDWRAVKMAAGLVLIFDVVLLVIGASAVADHAYLIPMLTDSAAPIAIREKPTVGPPSTAVRLKRRDFQSVDELSRLLLAVPELDLDTKPDTGAHVVDAARRGRSKFTEPILETLRTRTDLQGLPVAMGTDCQLGKESAQNLQVLSHKLRLDLSFSVPEGGLDPRIDAAVLRERLVEGHSNAVAGLWRQNRAGRNPADTDSRPEDWRQEDAVPTLVQMLQSEDRPVRLLLVELLAAIKGRAAAAALARRAVFDLSAEVREAAVQALANRPRSEFRQVLLDGLRYPWAPAADHAAEALAALNDREALPRLTALLDEPDPAQPALRIYHNLDPALLLLAPWPENVWPPPTAVVLDEGQGNERRTRLLPYLDDAPERIQASTQSVSVVREVVRVNHLRNCLLCHSPSFAATDPVRGLVPSPGQPLPPLFTTPYYEGRNGTFVRADVTYLRQDFSVPQPVAKADNWPAYQRYDYVVRTRYPTEEELRRKEPAAYPQRETVRWAIRELNGGKEG